MSIAPIILFVYKRLDHTIKTIEALKNNLLADQSELIVFSDGPKIDEEITKINEIRRYIKRIKYFKKIYIIEKDENCGLSNSIIDGVSAVIKDYKKAIILEDDIVTSKFFLKFMNDGLNLYEDYEEVISISAYTIPIKILEPKIFFLKWADCWGWATWERGWNLFEKDGNKLLKIIEEKELQKRFNLEANYLDMLKRQAGGGLDSWAIRWYASALVNNKLTLCPYKPLVRNIGLDGSGTNCGVYFFTKNFYKYSIKIKKLPLEENIAVLNKIVEYNKKLTFYKNFRSRIKKLLNL